MPHFWCGVMKLSRISLGRPREAVQSARLRAEVDGVGDLAVRGEDLDLHAVGRAGQLEAALAEAIGECEQLAGDDDVVADEARPLQRLHLHELVGQALHRRVELLDAAHGVDLRHLARHLRVVHRRERVLVLHLRDEQLQKAVRARGVGRADH